MKTNRIPIIVGVTGHRDLREEDVSSLEEKVREIMADLRERHPLSPLILLSSLAEGSDRLAARVALEAGIEVVAPLPMPAEEYQKDFHSDISRKEFSDLLARSTASLVLPYAPEVTAENIGEPEHRAQQYLRTGLYVLRHCHILLALWDGDEAQKTGGTSQMVHYKLTGFPTAEAPEWTVLNAPEAGTVFQVVTPRKSHPNPEGALSVRKYYVNPRFAADREKDGETTEQKAGKVFTALLAHTNMFNRDVGRFEKSLAAHFEASRRALEPEGADESLPEDLKTLLDRYAAADVLASRYQGWRHFFLRCLCVLIVPATVCLASFHAVDQNHPGWSFVFVGGFWAFILIAALLHFLAKFFALEAKHLDYRALAEGLKILFFWRLSGIRDDVGAQYLRKQRSELDWIRLAVRASDLLTSFPTRPEASYAWIKARWMEQQREYFDLRSTHNEKLAAMSAWTSRAFILLGLLLALYMVTLNAGALVSHHHFSGKQERRLHLFSIFIVGLLTAAGSAAAYAEKLAFTQQSKQYAQMRRLFTLAIRESDACLAKGEANHVRTIIRRLGLEALRENGDWVILHRERPMEVRLG
jgi:hypothetical protein